MEQERFVFIGNRKDNGEMVVGNLIQCGSEMYILPFDVTDKKLDLDGNLEAVQLIEIEGEVGVVDRENKDTMGALISFLTDIKTSIDNKIDYIRFALKLMN